VTIRAHSWRADVVPDLERVFRQFGFKKKPTALKSASKASEADVQAGVDALRQSRWDATRSASFPTDEEVHGLDALLVEDAVELKLQQNLEEWVRTSVLPLIPKDLEIARKKKPIRRYVSPTFELTAEDDMQVFLKKDRRTFVAVEAKAFGNAKFDGSNWPAVSPQVVVPLDALAAAGCDPAHCILSNVRRTWLFRLSTGRDGAAQWDLSGPFDGKNMFAKALLYAIRKGAVQYE
jgi:hypothetical protein